MRIENCQKKTGEKQRRKSILYLKQFEEAGVWRRAFGTQGDRLGKIKKVAGSLP